MDFDLAPGVGEFREEIRTWLDEHLVGEFAAHRGVGSPTDDTAWDVRVAWERELSAGGWLGVTWPQRFGGRGLGLAEEIVFEYEYARAAAPARVNTQALELLGPTLLACGTEEQCARFLPKILAVEQMWGQGFSEPGAGSDLADVRTKARLDGGVWHVDGQKIWTTFGHHADWLYVLARTDPDAPKHRGISFLLMDKHTPGISIRPLIDMSGRHHFNETFFEDVRVPASNRVGEENRGWYVGMTLLDFERSNITGAVSSRRTLDELREYLKTDEGKRRSPGYAQNRLNVAERYIETDVMFNFSFRIISMQDRGLIPNYEASVSKLFNSEMNQKIAMTGRTSSTDTPASRYLTSASTFSLRFSSADAVKTLRLANSIWSPLSALTRPS